MKFADTSITKVASAISFTSMAGAYCYVCYKSASMVDIPQSFIIVLGLLLGIEAVPAIKKKLDEKKDPKTEDKQ